MTYLEALLATVFVVLLMHYKPEFFSWFFYRIKTKYLRPEISILELLTIGLLVYLLINS
jgi:uncharacterized protein YacL